MNALGLQVAQLACTFLALFGWRRALRREAMLIAREQLVADNSREVLVLAAQGLREAMILRGIEPTVEVPES